MNGDVKEFNYISGPNGLIAVYIVMNGEGTLYYTVTDHLGSIIQLIDENGTVIEETNYGPWGRYRNPNTWEYDNTAGLSLIHRGYTGHEMLPEFDLIHMNGRMYDPVLGRMLSPDNFVQDPTNPQNYNRYSYCLNNPLKYTDPDGEFIFTALLSPIGLTPVGMILDAACWGGAIDLGIQGIQMATGTRESIDWAQVGGSAVAGAFFGGMGLIAPSFTVTSTSFAQNFTTYLGKAGWAGLTGMGASGAGMLATDLFEGGGIDYSGEDYLRTMVTAGAFSFGLSFAGSMYDYASWDQFTNKEKVNILKNKFDADIRYNASMKDKGRYLWGSGNQYVEIGPAGLTSRGQGLYTGSHELKHLSDWNLYSANKLSVPTNKIDLINFLEKRAHLHSMRRWSTSYNLWNDRNNLIHGRGGYTGYGYKGPVFSFGIDQLWNFFY